MRRTYLIFSAGRYSPAYVPKHCRPFPFQDNMSAKPAVAPVVATAVVVGVVNDDDGMVLNRAVPRGWTSGLCDCLNDCCSCFAVWCCTPITVAQLYVKLAYRGPESQAQVIFLAIASFLFARQVSEPGGPARRPRATPAPPPPRRAQPLARPHPSSAGNPHPPSWVDLADRRADSRRRRAERGEAREVAAISFCAAEAVLFYHCQSENLFILRGPDGPSSALAQRGSPA